MNFISQDDIFANFEGNQWFKRNKAVLEQFDPQKDLLLKVMEEYSLKPLSVLDIGGANGFRLAAMRKRFDVKKLVVVEPSTEAIRDGQKRFPFIEFLQGVASAIPLKEKFDLIIVNFVFHWIDRTSLLQSVAEIDRLCIDRGFLIIGDFLPSNRLRVSYHYLPDQQVYTYKQNYAAPFLASGLYQLVCRLSGKHLSNELDTGISEMERIGVLLLQKTLSDTYAQATLQTLQ